MFRIPAGLPALLKEGMRHYQGQEEAVFRNIDATKKLSEIVKSCYGPTAMSKLVNNFLNKRFLTSDVATVVSELEVQHPAAKILVLAAQMQASEFGDGTNFVILLAAELLHGAAQLLNSGIHMSAIIQGYDMALQKALEVIEGQVVYRVPSMTSAEEISKVALPIMATKVKNLDQTFVSLVVDACLSVMPSNPLEYFTDNVRVTKVIGGALSQSFMVNGMVLHREPKTAMREAKNCKVCVLGNALEAAATEGTATVLINSPDELKNFSKTEEAEMEEIIKSFHDAGVKALIVGGHVAPLALHYLDKYDMFAVATPSRFDIKRFCRTLRVPALQRLTAPMAEEIGTAEFIGVQEYGSQIYTVVRAKDTKVSTIVLRGPTRTILDEVERAIDDVVSLVKACTKDPRFVPGAAAVEFAVAQDILTYANSLSGLEQYAVEKFGNALHSFGRLIAENAGQNAMEAMAQLQSAHKAGRKDAGIDITKMTGQLVRTVTEPIPAESLDEASAYADLTFPVYDHYMTKRWGMRLAVEAALTVLRVDQIIMSKPAGGPKMQDRGHWDAQDDNAPME
eukprot:Blabericola_migrator_1__4794@NODE_251_length_10854_cov_130_762121_g212_i0_p2_GENE_NODE_251_length_10854_cov_130_762121_g212_i0NODE_251_length_10854_cov_130_762121_g212_i0_p2_ORF_typecomplete_len566_score96_28Cpn60_TCP1/PF00118_24/4e124GalP_UDP_transf/PF01087_22/0_21DUF3189/PF11385_8/0_32DUF4931/PF16285_5/0_24_NODE_251_length_10854_cov_130_762121_g212_i048336530